MISRECVPPRFTAPARRGGTLPDGLNREPRENRTTPGSHGVSIPRNAVMGDTYPSDGPPGPKGRDARDARGARPDRRERVE